MINFGIMISIMISIFIVYIKIIIYLTKTFVSINNSQTYLILNFINLSSDKANLEANITHEK